MLSRSRTHNQINSVTTFRSICLAPVNELLRGSAAANALVRELLLIKGDAARADLGQLLDLILALWIAAPHSADKAIAVLAELLLYLVERGAVIGVSLTVGESLFIQLVADSCELFGNGILYSVERNDGLGAVNAGDKHALALCNITRSELYAERNALHLILGELPAGGILGIVELYAEASREAVGKCTGSVKHALLVHLRRPAEAQVRCRHRAS